MSSATLPLVTQMAGGEGHCEFPDPASISMPETCTLSKRLRSIPARPVRRKRCRCLTICRRNDHQHRIVREPCPFAAPSLGRLPTVLIGMLHGRGWVSKCHLPPVEAELSRCRVLPTRETTPCMDLVQCRHQHRLPSCQALLSPINTVRVIHDAVDLLHQRGCVLVVVLFGRCMSHLECHVT